MQSRRQVDGPTAGRESLVEPAIDQCRRAQGGIVYPQHRSVVAAQIEGDLLIAATGHLDLAGPNDLKIVGRGQSKEVAAAVAFVDIVNGRRTEIAPAQVVVIRGQATAAMRTG